MHPAFAGEGKQTLTGDEHILALQAIVVNRWCVVMNKSLGKIIGLSLGVLTFAGSALAMTFSQPEKIGEVGVPAQAPYHGFIVKGESHNTGTPYLEDASYSQSGEVLKTYVKGIAGFGTDANALYCDYDFNSADFAKAIRFGGENAYVVALDGSDKDIFRIDNSDKMALYAIYHEYAGSQLNIIGRQPSGKWVSYINSKDISNMYFAGKDAYKEDGGVIYDKPVCRDDTIVVVYRRWHWSGVSEPEGEIHFFWDDKAQWFGVDQVVY